MAMKWWEKTVEYAFILRAAEEGQTFAIPLDGNYEAAGDTIFGHGNRWVLIEFKLDKTCFSTELGKFIQFEKAKADLSGKDHHHHLVFGSITEGETMLTLNATTYFSHKGSNSIKKILDSGISYDEFTQYLDKFLAYKKPPASGGRQVVAENFSLVAGINAAGTIVECISLAEFNRERGLELKHQHQHEMSRGGPSYDR